MQAAQALDIFGQVLWTTFWVSLPLLGIGFVIGVLVSLLQIVTSIQDSSFNAVPRLIAFLAGLMLFMPWMLGRMLAYTAQLWGDFGHYAR